MDNITLDAMARDCCPVLWTKFGGVWSADNFHLEISSGGNRNNHANLCDSMIFQFQLVNRARSNDVGRHWILLIVAAVPMKTTKNSDQYPQQQQQQQQGLVGYKNSKHKSVVLVWDCMDMPIRQYTHFFERLKFLFLQSTQMLEVYQIGLPIQTPTSNLCGLHCLYMAHYLIEKNVLQHFISFTSSSHQSISVEEEEEIDYLTLDTLLQPLRQIHEIDVVRFFNTHCKLELNYKLI